MKDELGIVGPLMESVGSLCGQTFRWIPADGALLEALQGAPGEEDVAALRADIADSDGAVYRRSDDGRWLGGVRLPAAGRSGALLTWSDRKNGSSQIRAQQAMEVLECVRALLLDHEKTTDESRQLVEELNNTYEDLHLFSSIVTQIRSLHYSEKMLRDLLGETREAMRVELAAALFTTGVASDVMVACPDIETLLPEAAPFLDKLVDEMIRSGAQFEGNCHIVNDASKIPVLASLHKQPFRALAVAIRNGDRQYGWLVLVSFNMKEIFRRGEYRLLSTMAEQIALVLANTDLYRDLELFVINLVKSFVTAIEAKDRYTKGHSERVSRLCVLVGEAMGLDEEQRRALRWASVLHDVGKIGTPEAILNKPARLSDDEFDTIKGHPAKGAQILSPIAQLADALPAIRHHHEHYDGTGYPDGVAAEAIPRLARIISVADTYDAITSDRAYRPGRSHGEAMRIIRDCAGTQLDPDVVEVFARVVVQDNPDADPVDRDRTTASAAAVATRKGEAMP